MNAARITITLTPTEFDLLREELEYVAKLTHEQSAGKTPFTVAGRTTTPSEARQRSATLRALLEKLQ